MLPAASTALPAKSSWVRPPQRMYQATSPVPARRSQPTGAPPVGSVVSSVVGPVVVGSVVMGSTVVSVAAGSVLSVVAGSVAAGSVAAVSLAEPPPCGPQAAATSVRTVRGRR
jgi:hypothetical protein